jgi:hypothetical protein
MRQDFLIPQGPPHTNYKCLAVNLEIFLVLSVFLCQGFEVILYCGMWYIVIERYLFHSTLEHLMIEMRHGTEVYYLHALINVKCKVIVAVYSRVV